MNPHEKCEVVRVKSTHKASQGDFVEINKADYNPAVHTLYSAPAPTSPPPAASVSEKPNNDGLNWASKEAQEKGIESGLDFSKVVGTGKNNKITMKDVDDAINASKNTVNFASDEAAELAVELGLIEEIAEIKGTGENGAITVEDLETYVDQKEGE
jgi:pyruvate/2-oxoglutarate dehydrogenase complex dihydrolipoamide acyltransferase (E2) component